MMGSLWAVVAPNAVATPETAVLKRVGARSALGSVFPTRENRPKPDTPRSQAASFLHVHRKVFLLVSFLVFSS
jgi:hypothetical protein